MNEMLEQVDGESVTKGECIKNVDGASRRSRIARQIAAVNIRRELEEQTSTHRFEANGMKNRRSSNSSIQ